MSVSWTWRLRFLRRHLTMMLAALQSQLVIASHHCVPEDASKPIEQPPVIALPASATLALMTSPCEVTLAADNPPFLPISRIKPPDNSLNFHLINDYPENTMTFHCLTRWLLLRFSRLRLRKRRLPLL